VNGPGFFHLAADPCQHRSAAARRARAVAPRILLVTDPQFSDEHIVRCVRAVGSELPRASFGVQLRDKKRLSASLRLFALRLRAITRAVGAPLFVNASAEIARDVDADGVHLGGGACSVASARAVLGKRAWISVAAHTHDDVRRAAGEGADAVLVSPVFPTRCHPEYASQSRGVGAIYAARLLSGSDLLVYALGGITAKTAGACAAAGADGVAMMHALLDTDRPSQAARAINDAFVGR